MTPYRHGRHIRIAPSVTATEGRDGNLPTLTIRRNGKVTNRYRGSSLGFSDPLTDEDIRYLQFLAAEVAPA